MCQTTRVLRVDAIRMIAELSQQFSQSDLDDKVFADISDGEIVGFDFSELNGMPSMCIGNRRVKLGNLTADNWCNMRCSRVTMACCFS